MMAWHPAGGDKIISYVDQALEQISAAGYDYQAKVLAEAIRPGMINLKLLQEKHKKWAEDNFGTGRSFGDPFLGMVEELGELAHALLKQKQGIRGSYEEHEEAAKDAVGDVFVFMMDFCTLKDWELEQIIFDTWFKVVSKRNWAENPTDGGS